jgi:hypothetical protein
MEDPRNLSSIGLHLGCRRLRASAGTPGRREYPSLSDWAPARKVWQCLASNCSAFELAAHTFTQPRLTIVCVIKSNGESGGRADISSDSRGESGHSHATNRLRPPYAPQPLSGEQRGLTGVLSWTCSQLGPPTTLGAAAQIRLIVWCKSCQHQVEPDPAGMAARYGADTSVLDWRERLV